MARRIGEVAALYRSHGGTVLRWILRFYRPEVAEEVLHEVFLKVLERSAEFRGDASPVTWLYRLTTNHCINRLRNERRRTRLWREQGQAVWRPLLGEADQEVATCLQQIWRDLDDDLVEAGFLHFVEGMTHAEVARICGCSPRTVGNRLERLRTLVQQRHGSSPDKIPGKEVL